MAAVVGLAAAAAALPVSAAAAVPARVWPGTTLTVADLTGGNGYHGAVRAAVGAWNRAGIGVRLVLGPDGPDALRISVSRGRCLSATAGRAPDGYTTAAAGVVVRPCPQALRPLLLAHELGRALGVPVSDRGCSLMNSGGTMNGDMFAVPSRCSPFSPPAWLSALVDPRTVAVARALYVSPAGPTEVELVAGAVPEVTWRTVVASGAAETVVLRGTPDCPTEWDLARGTGTVVYRKRAYAGLHRLVDSTLPPGTGSVCYGVFPISASGRASRQPGIAVSRPAASFTFQPAQPVAGAPVAFRDGSTPAGVFVRWQWDFGDPSSGAANTVDTTDLAAGTQPQHTFATAGSYAVVLTVTDAAGTRATTTQTLTVAAP